MNKPVADIVGAAAVHALPLGLAPGRSRTDFVDPAHLSESPACRLYRLGFSRNFRQPAATVSAASAHFKGGIPALAPARQSRFIEVIIRTCILDLANMLHLS